MAAPLVGGVVGLAVFMLGGHCLHLVAGLRKG